MKYVFGTDKTKEPENGTADGALFVSESVDKALAQRAESAVSEYRKLFKQAVDPLPFGLMLLKWLGALVGGAGLFVVIESLLRLGKAVPLDKVHRANPWFLPACGVGAAVFLALFLIETVIKKRAKADPRYQRAVDEAGETESVIKEKLGIPNNAQNADILYFDYKRTDAGGIDANSAVLQLSSVWRDGDELRMTGFDGDDDPAVLAFRLGELKRLEIRRLGFSVMDWHKDVPPTAGSFKRAGVLANEMGMLGLRFCAGLVVERGGEEYSLLFPAYELPLFSRLTGLEAPELPTKKELRRGNTTEPKERLEPLYYWRIPKGTKVSEWFMPGSDASFAAKHRGAFLLLELLGLVALLAPVLLYVGVAIKHIPASGKSLAAPAALLGALPFGIGLFNLVAAWLHQYLGHWVTLVCLIGGAVVMALPFVI